MVDTVKMVYLIIFGILLFLLVGAGAGAASPNLKAVREKYEKPLLETAGVAGVYHDDQTREIVVMVEKPEHLSKIPKELDGFKVRGEVTGRIYALETATASRFSQPFGPAYSRTGKDRPVFGGISLGTAGYPTISGTLGLVVTGTGTTTTPGMPVTTPGQPYVLTNAHVIALGSSSSPPNFLGYGTPVWQPGGADRSSGDRTIGGLWSYVPIAFDTYNFPIVPYNYADAAIGTLTAAYSPPGAGYVLNNRNNGFYLISGTTTVNTNDLVRKSGRTSGVTTGRVRSTSATVDVWYTASDWANYQDQIVTTAMVQPGDSGSAVDENGKFVGLAFAGSGTTTVICKAEHILGPLGIAVSS